MNLVIISGLSGSGKSVALNTLEDIGFYCIDNLPVGLLGALALELSKQDLESGHRAAVSIDARNHPGQLERFPEIIRELRESSIDCRILFLQAETETLLKRFSETRRKHPLTDSNTGLADAITEERRLLSPIAANADLFIDTSQTNIHQLRGLVRECMGQQNDSGPSLLLKSFGYKHGIPADADFVFDVRCLPNPHWETSLRSKTGLDKEVAEFLEREPTVRELHEHLTHYLTTWIPRFREDNRSYLSIAIGCTGGQHRSVYLVERLAQSLAGRFGNIVVRHRELG